MNFKTEDMNEESAVQTLNWKYREPYDFYNNEINEEELKERLNGSYKVIVDEDAGEIFGFFCLGEAARIPVGHRYGVYVEECMDVGIGINPEKTGEGYGFEFFSYIMNYIKVHYGDVSVRLSVAIFNERAIRLYTNAGFEPRNSFSTETAHFITMVKK